MEILQIAPVLRSTALRMRGCLRLLFHRGSVKGFVRLAGTDASSFGTYVPARPALTPWFRLNCDTPLTQSIEHAGMLGKNQLLFI